MPPTRYHILKLETQPGGVERITPVNANVAASSAEQAIRAHVAAVAAVDERAGRYVAVPSRSWKPVTVAVETTTRVTLKDA